MAKKNSNVTEKIGERSTLSVRNYGDTARLLFWDVSKSIEGADLAFEPVPTPEESQQKLETRAAELGR